MRKVAIQYCYHLDRSKVSLGENEKKNSLRNYEIEFRRSATLRVRSRNISEGYTRRRGSWWRKWPFFSMLSEKSIRTISIPFLERDISLLKEFSVLKSLIAIFKAEKPDVIHLNSSKIGGLGALSGRIAGVPRIVFTAHGWPYEEERPSYQRFLIYVASWFTVFLSHKTIVVSQADFARAPALLKRKIVYIPNGISAFAMLPRAQARGELMKTWSKDVSENIWIGAIAELTKNKGIDVALKAIANIKNVFFYIIGEGEENNALMKKARELGMSNRVAFTGFIPDARRLLPAFDIYVMPSRKEGLPYVLLEAGTAGLAVVASNVGGIPDIIDNGTSGVLVKKNNPKELEDALQSLVNNKETREKIGAELKSTVERQFSFSDTLSKTLNLYGERR